MKNTYLSLFKNTTISFKKLLFLLMALSLSHTGQLYANEKTTPVKSNNVPIPAGKDVVSSVIVEAEDNFTVVNDGENPDTNTNSTISLAFSEALSSASGDGKGVTLPDQVDAISVTFDVDDAAAEYVFNVRVRTGTSVSSNSMQAGYSFSIDGGAAEDFTLNNESLSPLSPNFGGAYFGVFESDNFYTGLTVGTHTIDITMVEPVTFGIVDYVEVVKVADTGTFTPATPGQVQNLQALVKGKNAIDIGWNPVSGADGYEIEVSMDGGANFTSLATLGQFEYYFAHTGLAAGTEYTYRVRATRTGASPVAGDYSTTISATTSPLPPNYFDVNQIATLGDDLALGTTATSATDQNLVFDTGIESENGTDFAVMPNGGAGGMTKAAAYHFKTLLNELANPENDYTGYEVLGTVAGLTGGKLADLTKGNATYDKLIAQIDNAQTLANGKSLTHKLQAVNLLQGDADAGSDTAAYTTALVQLAADLNADINTALDSTGATFPVFITQSSDPLIAVAQYRAAKQAANLYITAPGYFTDNTTEAGRQQLGQYAAKLYQAVSFQESGWTGVSPANIAKAGNTVTIEFNVPVAPLVLDATTVTNPGNSGFELFDTDGQLTITDVSISEGNKVVITADRIVGGDARVSYAATAAAPRGNLRDSDTQAATLGGATLHNWAVAFEETIANTAPNTPTGLTATAISDVAIQLSWDALAGNVSTYTIEVSVGDDQNFTVVDEIDKANTEFEHTGLTAETTYFYRIKANNLGLSSEYSTIESATTLPAAPNAPQNLVATVISDAQVDLAWDAVTGTITGYVIERATVNEEASFAQVDSLAASETAFSDTGLAGGTTYFYRVKAVNGISSSDYSNVEEVTTETPDGPTGITAEGTSATTIEINWDAVSGAIDNYVLESSDAADGTFTELATVDAATTTFTHESLTADTTVFYRVKTVSSGVSSGYSTVVSGTTLSETPDAPTALTATVISSSQIDLSWTAPSSTITGYELESSDTGTEGTFTLLASPAAGETTYSHTGLAPSTTVYYRLKAINNNAASEYTATVNATTEASPIGEPTDLVATDSTDTEITISWTAGTGEIDEYVIESSATANSVDFVELARVDDATTTYTHTGLTPDTTIFYRVLASNAFTTSAFSNTLEASTLPATPAAPANFTAVASATNLDQVELAWDAVTENVDGYIIEESTSDTGPFSQIAALGAAETSFVRTVDNPGQTYFYRIKATNGEVSSEYSATVSVVTDLDDALFFGNFEVFPNPSDGKIRVELSAEKNETGLIKIFSTTGKKVFENAIDSNFNGTFNLNNLNKGLYIIDIKTKSYRQTRKLLIN